MLDIIIPVYNNEKGLYDSLFSLCGLAIDNKIYIIDDCSTDKIDYSQILSLFQLLGLTIVLVKLPQNKGPGFARQIGIEHSNNDYILFLDCGDILFNPSKIKTDIEFMQNNNYEIISYTFIQQINTVSYQKLNTQQSEGYLLSKIISRKFWNKYNLHFNLTASYYFEDAAINAIITNINRYYYQNNLIYYSEEPIIIYTFEENSLTKNQYKFFQHIEDQAKNLIYAISESEKLQIPENVLIKQKYEHFFCVYYNFLLIKENYPSLEIIGKNALYILYCNWFQGEKIEIQLFYSIYINLIHILYKVDDDFSNVIDLLNEFDSKT